VRITQLTDEELRIISESIEEYLQARREYLRKYVYGKKK
jgi:hypothetical protein